MPQKAVSGLGGRFGQPQLCAGAGGGVGQQQFSSMGSGHPAGHVQPQALVGAARGVAGVQKLPGFAQRGYLQPFPEDLASYVRENCLSVSYSGNLDFDLADVFGDSATIVESALSSDSKFTVTNADGDTFIADYNSGSINIGAAVPEPATWAAIAGALALAFAAYRRRA